MMAFLPLYFEIGVIVAIFFALLEIQIEGKHGWAKKLPTWRKQFWLFNRIFGRKKELTGYHVSMWLFIFSMLHTAFIFAPWTLQNEALVFSLYIFITLSEDFLWFVLNPAFGLKKFIRKYVTWHPKWLGPLPFQYYLGIMAWVALFWFGINY